jgi:hypothetical protein
MTGKSGLKIKTLQNYLPHRFQAPLYEQMLRQQKATSSVSRLLNLAAAKGRSRSGVWWRVAG